MHGTHIHVTLYIKFLLPLFSPLFLDRTNLFLDIITSFDCFKGSYAKCDEGLRRNLKKQSNDVMISKKWFVLSKNKGEKRDKVANDT